MIDIGFTLKPITEINFQPPPQESHGSQEREPIFLSVGRALSSWELVESSLADMYHVLVELNNDLLIKYGLIFSSNPKSDLLLKSAKVFIPKYLPDFSISEFEQLIENYKNGAMRRNEIAHGIVAGLALNGNDNRGLFLCPPSYNSLKTKQRNQAFFEEAALKYNEDPFYLYGMNFRYTYQNIDHFNSLFEPLRTQAVQLCHLFRMTFISQMGQKQ